MEHHAERENIGGLRRLITASVSLGWKIFGGAGDKTRTGEGKHVDAAVHRAGKPEIRHLDRSIRG